jgi:asparagine synthase (glutamine-hydrolysing)
MQVALQHRGPDDSGCWLDEAHGIAIGFVRLAVLDLSEAGAQPMRSRSDRYVFSFNGEIYNHRELRQRLEQEFGSIPWRGHSDSETLLECIDRWGFAEALQATIGMFAVAVWDRETAELLLARDRFGEKPLYYGWQQREGRPTFLYGSELKVLRCHPAFAGEVDRDSLAQYMRYGYVVAPRSIYAGIHKLLPGTWARVCFGQDVVIEEYWSARKQAARGLEKPLDISEDEAVSELQRLLSRAIERQRIADVPTGAFLSGGLDSSTVVSLMQSVSPKPVDTFTIGFEEEAFNEAGYASKIAAHLGTQHHELILSARDALEVVPKLPQMYDEPLADNSQIPTYLLAVMARQHVTVALTGDGGDELFAGYDRYTLSTRLWDKVSWAPLPVRRAAGATMRRIPKRFLNRLGPRGRYSTFGDTMHRAADVIAAGSAVAVSARIGARWPADGIVIGGSEPSSAYVDPPHWKGSAIEAMMITDIETYMPDDILAKVDRASMAVALETRLPFLDHEVAEFTWQLPLNYKLRNGRGKWITRQLLRRFLPEELIERPKMGFSMPVDTWLRGPLREWAEELLDERRIAAEGFFEPAAIARAWRLHKSGEANLRGPLWSVLMFQAWLSDQRI